MTGNKPAPWGMGKMTRKDYNSFNKRKKLAAHLVFLFNFNKKSYSESQIKVLY
jgi:hypothetical protein